MLRYVVLSYMKRTQMSLTRARIESVFICHGWTLHNGSRGAKPLVKNEETKLAEADYVRH